jgi:exonuclease III
MPFDDSNHSLRIATMNVGQGLVRKLPDLLSHCTALTLDIIALQEIGDPAIIYSTLHHYSLSLSAGSSNHEGGVGILLSRTLTPFCRTYRRSKSGRLHAVVLELSKGQQTLIVSVYMPSGLDRRAESHPDGASAVLGTGCLVCTHATRYYFRRSE